MAKIAIYGQPSRLYRHRALTDTSIDREIRAFTDGHIFCPRHDQLNDPMEGAHSESALLQQAKSYLVTKKEVGDAMDALGIASFSETNLSEPMWAHYAGKFSGMCVAYNFKKILRELDEESRFVRMAYSEKPPLLLRDKMSATDRARMVLSTKALRWAAEREWRLIRPESGPASYHSTNCVSAIYIGSRAETEHKRAIKRAALKMKIPIYVMEIDKYEISFKRSLMVRKAGSSRKRPAS